MYPITQEHLSFNPRAHRHEEVEHRPRFELNRMNSYTPGYWKHYIATEISHSTDKSERSSSFHSKGHPHQSNASSGYQGNLGNLEEDGRIQAILSQRREEERRREQERRRKEETLKKVRELQQKVLPMVRNRDHEEDSNPGWQARIEQKLMRLESEIDGMGKSMALEMERRVLEIQNKWERRFEELYKSMNN